MARSTTSYAPYEIEAPRFDYENNRRYYRYSPLPTGWIRLARCYQGNWHGRDGMNYTVEDLELQMLVFPMEEAPPYDALSYTWGPARVEDEEYEAQQIFSRVERIYPIRCDGGFVRVTKSLREVLWLMCRYSDSDARKITEHNMGRANEIWFWADGLCINQDDLQERARCVAMMGDIYSKASTVLTYLGRQDSHTAAALRVNEALVKLTKEQLSTLRHRDFFNSSIVCTADGRAISERDWCDWMMLFTRKWFTRTWIVQEAGLGGETSHLLFGLESLRLANLIYAFGAIIHLHWQCFLLELITKHQHSYPVFKRLGTSLTDLISGNWHIPTIHLIWAAAREKTTLPSFGDLAYPLFGPTSCSNPRDRIYAAMGVSSEFAAPARFPVDYAIAIPELFATASKFIMDRNPRHQLDLLTNTVSQGAYTKERDLPSWCPDFDLPSIYQPCSLWRTRPLARQHWRAGGSFGVQSSISTPWQQLSLLGYRADFVASVHLISNFAKHTILRSFEDVVGILGIAAELTTRAVSDVKHNLSTEASSRPIDNSLNRAEDIASAVGPVEMLWRTLFCNVFEDSYPAESGSGPILGKYLTFELCRSMWSQTDPSQRSRLDSNIAALKRHIQALLANEPHAKDMLPDIDFLSLEVLRFAFADLLKYPDQKSPLLADLMNRMTYPSDKQHYMTRLQPYRLTDENVFPNVERQTTAILLQRSVFNTLGARIGIGPDMTQPDDEIWLLAGGRTPFVLRPKGNGNHTFVGECFVYGMMDGEYWPRDRDELMTIVLE